MARKQARDSRGRFASGGSGSAPKRVSFRRAYHGTTPAAAAAIKRSGFRVDPDGVYGPGAYAGTKGVARMYGKALVPVRVPKSRIAKAEGSSRQVRQAAQTAIPKGKAIRFPHAVGDTGKKQSAYVIGQDAATKGIDRRSVLVRSRKKRKKP